MSASYRATVVREGAFWVATVPEVAGAPAATQARQLADVASMVRDLVVTLTGADPSDVQVDLNVALPGQARRALRKFVSSQRRARELAARAAEDQRAAARELVDAGISVRDAGTVLGVSPQRVSQLTGRRRPGVTALVASSD